MKILLKIGLVLHCTGLSAQPVGYRYTDTTNLIFNPGFEEYNASMPPGGAWYNLPTYFHVACTNDSPDHFVYQPGFYIENSWQNSILLPFPKEGNGYAGQYFKKQRNQWGNFVSDEEMLVGKLKSIMPQGKYEFKLSLSKAKWIDSSTTYSYNYSVHSLGVALVQDSVSYNFVDRYLLFGEKWWQTPHSNVANSQWEEISVIVESNGGEKYFVIGYSDTNAVEPTSFDSDTLSYFAYFFYDNLSLRRIEPIAIDENTAQVFPNPSPDGAFTLEVYGNETVSPVFSLYDATGRLVQQEFLAAGYQRKAVHYPSLASGIYTWRVEDRNNGNAVMGRGKVVVGR